MTGTGITEAGTVQFPMVSHAAEIGWTPLSPSDTLAIRGGEAGLLFRGVLEDVLHRFNPRMTDDAVRSVVENIQALPPTIEGNRADVMFVVNGVPGDSRSCTDTRSRHPS